MRFTRGVETAGTSATWYNNEVLNVTCEGNEVELMLAL